MQTVDPLAQRFTAVSLGASLLAAAPWLNPFAPGPSPAVVPWLVSMACGIVLWILAASLGRHVRVPHGLLWGGLVLAAWAAVSQLAVLPETVALAAGILLLALSAGATRDAQVAKGLQAGFLAAAAVSAAIGLCQYFGFAGVFSPWMSSADLGEAFGNLRQPNQYATLCWIGAGVALFGTLRLPTWARLALVVVLAAGSAASVSRTGLLQGLVLTAVAMVWRGPDRHQRLLLCAAAAFAYLASAVLMPLALEAMTGAMPARTLWGRWGGGDGAACSSRLVLWSNVLHLIAQKPLAGWGWGELDYAHFNTLYAGPRFCYILDNAHNLPLHLGVELGVPAALLVCGGALWWTWRQRPLREAEALRQLAWSLAAIIVLHSMLEYPLWYGPFQIAFGASLGWLLREPVRAQFAWRVPAPAMGAVLLALTGYAGWDYTRVSQLYLPPGDRHAVWRDDTLSHAQRSWLFSGQARFAELTLATPQRDNAEWMYPLARQVMHLSPEPKVIERAIESAAYLGRLEDAVSLLARFRAAFPQEHEAWRRAQRVPNLSR